MTIASETNRSGPYNGNGATTVYNYGFRIVSEGHLSVVRTAANGVETVLALGADYTVSGAGVSGGGQITCAIAPPVGTTLTILRDVPFTQETDYENQGAYFAETVEDALDLGVMRDQQLKEGVDRAHRAPFGEAGGTFSTADILNASANAAAAAASAAAADASEAGAAASAAAADASEAAAAASAAAADASEAGAAAAAEAAANAALATKADKLNPLFTRQGGAEGGQVRFEKPATGTTLAADVEAGLTGDQLQIGEAGGRKFILDIAEVSGTAKVLHEDNVATNFAAKLAYFGNMRENAFPSLMQWVTDAGAVDWAPYFNAAFAAIAAVSQYKGTKIIIPGERRIQISKCNAITSCGVVIEAQGSANWPDNASDPLDAAQIYCLGGTDPVFTWGNGVGGDVRGGGVRGISMHADNRVGGALLTFNGVWGFKVEDIEVMGCYDAIRILGGYDPVLRDVRIEGYRNTGIVAEGTDTLRGDRLNLRNVSIAGRGTEVAMTSTGDALRILGNWHTVEMDTVRLVKCGRYGLNIESQYADPELFPHYITIDNLQFDYGNNSAIFAMHVQDLKLDKGYFNGNLNGNQMNFGANATEIMLSKMRSFGSRNRAISFLGKTMSVTESTFRGWDKQNSGEAAIVGDNCDGVKVHGNYFGPVGRFASDPDSAGNLAYYQVGNGSVSIQGNTTKGLAASPFSVPGGAPQSIANNVVIP